VWHIALTDYSYDFATSRVVYHLYIEDFFVASRPGRFLLE